MILASSAWKKLVYRCPRGHETPNTFSVSTTLADGRKVETGPRCMVCMIDFVKQHALPAELVEDGK